MDLLFHLVLGRKECKEAIAALNAAGETGAAIAAVGAGVFCASTLGAGCIAMLGAIGAAVAAKEIKSDQACGKVDQAQIAFQLIDRELKKINSKLDDLKQEVAKLGISVKYGESIETIEIIKHAYQNIEFDKDGNLKSKVVERKYVEIFTGLALGLSNGVGLHLSLDRLDNMLKSPRLYQEDYFCKLDVRQYYNLLMLEGYDLLFKAHAMRGHFDNNNLVKEFEKRIRDNNELAANLCSKFLNFGFVLCFMFAMHVG